MFDRFGRKYELKIITLDDKEITITPELRITFDVTKSIKGSLNKATVQIYNLSQTNRDKIKKDEAKGIKRNTIRMMIVGIPNVGKSTLINSLVKRKAQEAYNMPGVTKEVKWIRINENLDLLDTPGVLWPKFDDQEVAKKLALTRAIKDSIYQEQELSVYLLEFLKEYYPDLLKERYDVSLELCNYEILKEIALKRGFFKADDIDYDKAAVAVLADFRNMRIGRITLDK